MSDENLLDGLDDQFTGEKFVRYMLSKDRSEVVVLVALERAEGGAIVLAFNGTLISPQEDLASVLDDNPNAFASFNEATSFLSKFDSASFWTARASARLR